MRTMHVPMMMIVERGGWYPVWSVIVMWALFLSRRNRSPADSPNCLFSERSMERARKKAPTVEVDTMTARRCCHRGHNKPARENNASGMILIA
jgi:hypothetical protein